MRINRLKDEKSPYLLQHMHNAVDWYPWGGEALERAAAENKPLFISIGYSTCHWCHVMARESFEDAEVAAVLNESFIPIKVDKEERPDIDSIYMNACVTMNGQGGWPLTIIATPDQHAFFTATYLPPRTDGGRTGLTEILRGVAEQWKSGEDRLREYGNNLTDYLKEKILREKRDGAPARELFERTVSEYERSYDRLFGGFGDAPKFPSPHSLMFLMRYAYFEKHDKAMKMAEETLEKMYRGGIYDHIGGGFCRYSTDRQWLAPHFEKMLYDNALLATAYLEAFQITGKELFRDIAETTLEFIIRELMSTEGGFWTALDADADGGEGVYYTFSYDEILGLLGEEKGKLLCKFFDITPKGNFEGANIPNLIKNRNAELNEEIKALVRAVYHYRRKRYSLHTDDKIITALNSLTVSAFIKGYTVTEKEAYLVLAKKAMQFISDELIDGEGNLYAVYTGGRRLTAGLDDHAYYCRALINMYEATFETKYLKAAVLFAEKTAENFGDEKGGFFMTDKRADELIFRPKESFDGAMPSGNSVMGYVFEKLARLTRREDLETLSARQADYLSGLAAGRLSYGLIPLMMRHYPSEEIIAVAENYDKLGSLRKKMREFRPNTTYAAKILMAEDASEYATYLYGYGIKNNTTTYYVCENKNCRVTNLL